MFSNKFKDKVAGKVELFTEYIVSIVWILGLLVIAYFSGRVAKAMEPDLTIPQPWPPGPEIAFYWILWGTRWCLLVIDAVLILAMLIDGAKYAAGFLRGRFERRKKK